MTASILLEIPYEVPSKNKIIGCHWSVKHKHRTTCETLLRVALGSRKPAARGQRSVSIIAYRKRLITDDMNFRTGCIPLIDALKAVGLIEDDSDKLMKCEYNQRLASCLLPQRVMTSIHVIDWQAANL